VSRKETGKPIPGDWDGENYSLYLLCGPDSILWDGYIRGAIFELTRGRQWDGNTGNIKAVQDIAWEIYDSMAKCNELVTAIKELGNVQVTINNSGGGCGCCDDGEDLGGSTIQNGGGGEPYYGSEPPAAEDRTGDPPPGFDSWTAYDQNKCNVSSAIVSGLALWFRRFSQVQDVGFVTGGLVLGLAAGTVLTFPPAIIVVIIGIMVLLYVESQSLEALADDIEANKDELQCGIYNALSSTAGIDFLRSKLSIFIDNQFPAAVAWAAKKLITFVVSVDTMNKAFVDKIGQNLPDADCSGCGLPLTYIHAYCGIVQGEYVSGDFNSVVVIDSVATKFGCSGADTQFVGIQPTSGGCLHFEFVVISGNVDGTQYRNCDAVTQLVAGTPSVDAQSVHLRNTNNVPFRVEITISEIV